MEYLKELSSKLQTCIYIDEAYQLIAQYVCKLLPDSPGHLYLMHASRNYLESMISWEEPTVDEKIIKPEDCMALRRGSMVNIENPSNELVCLHTKSNSHDIPPYTCIPLYAQSDIIGLLYLEWKTAHALENKNNMTLACMTAEQIALGLSNIKLRETLKYQSVRDPLTGLYNRRYLEVSLEREMNRCMRKSRSIAVLMIDIDHFKRFNDEFGHEAGDLVIQSFADILREGIRKSDISCRYGGEEFILVIPEIDTNEVLERTKTLHEAVKKMQLQYRGTTLPPITISIGLAIYPRDGSDVTDIIAAADTALYQAKNSGRNKTVQYESKS